ncbi:MAG TPA: acyltransferase, partial [Polyangiaceae bacterium]|nr:acyltransferase [Polyangiaceae bacterium]
MTRAGYLPALDGLRALSVLAVIGFHAELPRLGGGFLGVEVFFVVSGYLITSLLLLEWQNGGTISLPQFWLRRARRLLPAVFALLLAALTASLTLAPDSLAQTRSDAAAALLYFSNWWQVFEHHSYFMAVERPPLLQHLWSLAVEEQFYLIWPLIVVLLAGTARRWLGLVALLGASGSALWMAHLFDPASDPTRVYVGSDTRMSGLLLGAALAASLTAPTPHATSVSRVAQTVRETLALAGLATLCWAFVHFDSHAPFLYRGGLVLVDLASCALLTGLLAPTSIARLLGAAPFAWLGRRSYGLYLWHWPIFALTRPDFDVALGGLPLLALRLALTVLVSELCYQLIETPVRRGQLGVLLRTRPLVFGTSAVLLVSPAASLIFLSSTRLAVARSAALGSSRKASDASAVAVAKQPAVDDPRPMSVPRAISGIPFDPAWPKTLTLLSDSVGLALGKALPAALPGWKVEVLGRP